METIQKFGIADCHGIESYLDKGEFLNIAFPLQLRVQSNMQRHR